MLRQLTFFLTFMNQKFQFMTFTFNLPEQMFHMALLLLRQNCAELFLKFMHKCRSYGLDKLSL